MTMQQGFDGEDMVVYTKVKYEDEMRLLSVKASVSLSELRTTICELFKLNGDARHVEIRFTDPDDDILTMSTDNDVKYAFYEAVCPLRKPKACLRLEISWSRQLMASLSKSLGPCGGGSGAHWDDGTFEGIKAITVIADSTTLYSIQVTYAIENGKEYTAPRHGGGAGERFSTVFDYPSEKLQKISGYCGVVGSDWTVIKALTFQTNFRSYGPFGVVDWIPFELDFSSIKVAGFYGRCSTGFLDSFGPHILP